MSNKIYVFKVFERFWHWSQAGLIIFLLITGFEVHGSYTFFGFGKAANYHTIAAWTLVGLWVFAIFWHFTTGEWKQYIPTLQKVDAMMKYYLFGIFKVFERFWHWSQAGLIIFLLLTGFEVHGSYTFFGFGKAADYHTIAAWTLVGLWVFAIFWHFTTGEWKQYIPTLQKVDAMMKYYLFGIFTNAPHPFKATTLKKHNPLQRLAYLGVMLFIGPLIWFTGWFYIFYDNWTAWGWDKYLSLEWVAFFHTVAAFLMLLFLIVHLYLTTAGHTPTAHIKAMITGWEEVD